LHEEERFLSSTEIISAVFDDFKTIESQKKEVSAQVEENLDNLHLAGEILQRRKKVSKLNYWAVPGVNDHEFN
jgi:hypothetical protein